MLLSSSKQQQQIKNEKNAHRAIELIFNNKINAKNAFEVDVDFLENIPKYVNENEENAWQKASASLDASSRIYGFRVDSTHNDTFRFLSGLSRNKQKEEEGDITEYDKGDDKKIKDERNENTFISAHLEEDKDKLILKKCDMDTKVDPIFIQMSTMFSGAGAKGFLLNSLTVDNYLDIILEEKQENNTIENNSNNNNNANANDIGQFDELNKIINDYTINVKELLQTNDNKGDLVKGLNAFKQHQSEKKCNFEDWDYFRNMINKEEEGINSNMDIIEEPVVILEEEVKSLDEPESNNNEYEKENELFGLEPNQIFNNTDKIDMGNQQNNNDNNNEDYSNAFLPGFDPLLLDSLGKNNNQTNIPLLLKQKTYLNALPGQTHPNKKQKIEKEEVLFKFSELSSVNRDKIFDSKRKGVTKITTTKHKADILNNAFLFRNGKVYHIKENLFRPFLSKNLHEDIKKAQLQNQNNDNNDININEIEDTFIPLINNDDEHNPNIQIENKAIIDKEYLNHYGSMYKTFDMKYLKKVLYSTYQSMSNIEQHIHFQSLYNKLLSSLDEITARNISPQIIFSIMLILAGEKSIEIIQSEESDDIILSAQNI